MKSPDDAPPPLTEAILRFSTILLDAVPCGLVDDQRSSALGAEELQRLRKQQTTCRYLIALFSMDSLCWGCYKAMEYEALESARVANALDPTGFPFRCDPKPCLSSLCRVHCCGIHSRLLPPFSAIALTTFNNFLEQLFEFFASAAVPFLYYRVMSKTRFETGPLAIFSMKVGRGSASGWPHWRLTSPPPLTSPASPQPGLLREQRAGGPGRPWLRQLHDLRRGGHSGRPGIRPDRTPRPRPRPRPRLSPSPTPAQQPPPSACPHAHRRRRRLPHRRPSPSPLASPSASPEHSWAGQVIDECENSTCACDGILGEQACPPPSSPRILPQPRPSRLPLALVLAPRPCHRHRPRPRPHLHPSPSSLTPSVSPRTLTPGPVPWPSPQAGLLGRSGRRLG